MSRLTPVVLIVDDDQDTRDLYELALTLDGLRTVVVATAEHALACIGDVNPDVIVTDISLGGRVDGYELLRQQQERPIIVLTGWADRDHIARAYDAGCTTVLVKPCAPDDLAAAIRSVLASAS
jgi:DNA-binding response OmpR family regulator